jgi:6-phosphogluconate dehydrogenase
VRKLPTPQTIGYFGQVGAGHYVKMVHNGIEYGMMQAIAEEAAVLKYSQFELDLAEVFREASVSAVIWQDDEWRVYRVEK